MEPFIFGERNGIHILDLQQLALLGRALTYARCRGKRGPDSVCWYQAGHINR